MPYFTQKARVFVENMPSEGYLTQFIYKKTACNVPYTPFYINLSRIITFIDLCNRLLSYSHGFYYSLS